MNLRAGVSGVGEREWEHDLPRWESRKPEESLMTAAPIRHLERLGHVLGLLLPINPRDPPEDLHDTIAPRGHNEPLAPDRLGEDSNEGDAHA